MPRKKAAKKTAKKAVRKPEPRGSLEDWVEEDDEDGKACAGVAPGVGHTFRDPVEYESES